MTLHKASREDVWPVSVSTPFTTKLQLQAGAGEDFTDLPSGLDRVDCEC